MRFLKGASGLPNSSGLHNFRSVAAAKLPTFSPPMKRRRYEPSERMLCG
jgi:hypothetical protein